jgi:HPt (histidine-containing phosphotransfer) domain-containing protein
MAPYRSFSPEAALADLHGSEPVLRAMAQTFLDTAHESLARTAQARADADHARLLHEVHSLRGSFAVLRAEPARALAAAVHRSLDGGALPRQEAVDALLAAGIELVAELRAWLADR